MHRQEKRFSWKKIHHVFYLVNYVYRRGMMPTYTVVVRDAGFIDSMWALITPGALSVYNMIASGTFSVPTFRMGCLKLLK